MITPEKIAMQCEWDGGKIFTVMCDALTEANFHTLRVRLESTFADWLYEEQTKEEA